MIVPQIYGSLLMSTIRSIGERTESMSTIGRGKKQLVGLAVVAALVGLSLAWVPTTADAFALVNKRSDKCADVTAASRHPNELVQQYDCHYEANQQWLAVPAPSAPGYYWLVNVNSGMCLDLQANSEAEVGNDTLIQQFYCNPEYTSERWQFEYVPSEGHFRLRNWVQGICLDNDGIQCKWNTTRGVGVASASSSLDFWVKSFQFHAGIFDAELPIDAALFGVRLVGPGANFRVQFGQFTDAASADALARQAAQLAFRDIQPAAVFRGVAEFDPFQVRSRKVRFKRFIERAFGVRVEVVAHEGHIRAIGIARIQYVRDFDRPVGLRPPCAGGRLSETRERFGKHENAGRPIAFVFVIHTLAMLRRRGDRHPRFLEQLDRLFVHTQHGMLWIVRFRVGFQHVFHAGHELARLAPAESPSTRSCVWSCHFF